jgi:hypothetical protein
MWSKPRMKKTKKILEKTIETKKKCELNSEKMICT